MNKTLSIATSIFASMALLAVSVFANADHKRRDLDFARTHDYARVTEATPIYKTVTRRLPVEKCWVETVRADHYHDNGSTLVGGLVGAAIGHKLGHKKSQKRVGAVAGAIIGASIADSHNRRDRRVSEYRDVKRCNTHYDVESFDKLVGYDVIYRYNGQTYRTRTDSHPGKRIPIRVSVRPAF